MFRTEYVRSAPCNRLGAWRFRLFSCTVLVQHIHFSALHGRGLVIKTTPTVNTKYVHYEIKRMQYKMAINLIRNLIAILLLFHQSNSLSVPSSNKERQQYQRLSRRDVVYSILRKPIVSSLVLTTAAPVIHVQKATAAASLTSAAGLQQDSRMYVPGVAGGARFVNLIVEDPNGANEPWNPTPSLVTNLGKARILANELSPLNPSLIPFSSDSNELYYGK